MNNKINNEMKNIDMNIEDVKFFKELYKLMDKYNIHRIYNVSLDKSHIITSQQLLGNPVWDNNSITKFIFRGIENTIPWVYFNICYRVYLFGYRQKLKKLFRKYDIEKIEISVFSLYQGISISKDSLNIRDINLVYKNGKNLNIENLYMKI